MIQIPDDKITAALRELHSDRAALARAAYEVQEKRLKVVLAREASASNLKTVGERENAALCSAAYAEALEAFRLIAEEYHSARDRRDAAEALLDAWRTLQATNRSMVSRAA
jgi:hypothetical protein